MGLLSGVASSGRQPCCPRLLQWILHPLLLDRPLYPSLHNTLCLTSLPNLSPCPALVLRSSAGRSSSSSRFPSPILALTQSIDDTWQRAVPSSAINGDHSFSAVKLQHDLTR